jgi:hypothetical protein
MRSTLVHRAQTLLATLLLGAALAAPAAAEDEDERRQPAADPFARRAWHLELGGHAALETWNYNISHEELFGARMGLTYGLGNGIVLIAGAPLTFVSQRGVDGWQLGATAGLRGRVYRRGRLSAFLEFEVGVSEADTFVPPRGTRFNYLLIGGAGATMQVKRHVHLLAGMKLIHVSNSGIAGRHRNPDIEAVGPFGSVLIAF